jgi:hypothetical protein
LSVIPTHHFDEFAYLQRSPRKQRGVGNIGLGTGIANAGVGTDGFVGFSVLLPK